MNKSEAKAHTSLLMAIYGPSNVSLVEGAWWSEWGVRFVDQKWNCTRTLWSRYDVIDAIRNAPKERITWTKTGGTR